MRFTLIPFKTSSTGNIAIPALKGSIIRSGSKLHINFLPDASPGIIWPHQTTSPERRDNLWKSTCFECFIGTSIAPSYIEINASPQGHWQSYHFSHYRKEMTPCADVLVKVESSKSDKEHSLILDIEVSNPGFVTTDWKVSVCAILCPEESDPIYYANQHLGDQPDFHLPESRLLRLDL